MKVRRVSEYETLCIGCGAKVRIMADEVDFRRGYADQRIPCPVCGSNIEVLKNGFVPSSLVPKIYANTWEGVNAGEGLSGT